MKIIAGNYFGKNIQFVCRSCNCVYEVESKDDWNIRMVFPNYCSFKYKVPEYEVACPNCGHREYLGFDQDDLIGTESENLYCPWIPLLKKREDWNKRYRVESIRE